MSTLLIVVIVVIVLVIALLSGWVAKKIGRGHLFWFWISVALPVVGLCILICLPEKQGRLIVIETGDQFSHLFSEQDSTTILN